PSHKVVIGKAFAVGRFSTTFNEWDGCVAHGACAVYPFDHGWGRRNRPVINVSWNDVKKYLAWLSKQTGKTYRLLTEAEWEYAARAGPRTYFPWGSEISDRNEPRANCNDCGSQWDNKQTAPVGSFKPNALGLHDMHGNVWQWVEDCYHDNYEAAPADGSAWTVNCRDNRRVLRGGSFISDPEDLRSAKRKESYPDMSYVEHGFRVRRTRHP